MEMDVRNSPAVKNARAIIDPTRMEKRREARRRGTAFAMPRLPFQGCGANFRTVRPDKKVRVVLHISL